MNITEVPFTLELILKKEEFENRVSILITHQCFRSPLRRNLATIKSPGILHLSLSKTRAGRHQGYRSVVAPLSRDGLV